MELEIDEAGEDSDNARRLLAIANQGQPQLYCKHDGSLNDGFELVTHPMSLSYHRTEMPWEALLREAVRMGYLSHQSGTCGLHIHVSREAFGDTHAHQEAAIARMLYFFEKHWEELLKFSRRTQRQLDRCAARRFAFRFPGEVKILMGHTRMTTQGSEKQNQNNHPFPGKAGAASFALAHNGVLLHNDNALRRIHRLPGSWVQTDSYVAVQLLEEAGEISHASLAAMAEELEGSFTFTVLTDQNSLFFLKGNNPLSLWHFPESGAYLYASTEEILTRAAARAELREKKEKVLISQEQILEIDSSGQRSWGRFDDSRLDQGLFWRRSWYPLSGGWGRELRSLAGAFGYSGEDVARLESEGYTPEEIEDWLYGACLP